MMMMMRSTSEEVVTRTNREKDRETEKERVVLVETLTSNREAEGNSIDFVSSKEFCTFESRLSLFVVRIRMLNKRKFSS